MIPIFHAHDYRRPIGSMRIEHGRLIVKFIETVDITADTLHEIFGNCGYRVMVKSEHAGGAVIREFEIIEWSRPETAIPSPREYPNG